MSIVSALAVTAAVAAGTAGAVTAYQLASPEPASAPAIETTDQATGPDRPRFAPCKKPARLKDGQCVSHLTRTVVVPGSAFGAASGAPAAPSPRGDDGTPDVGDDARRDLADGELVVVQDDDLDDDDGTRTRTRTRSGTDSGTNTSTSTSTGHSGTSG